MSADAITEISRTRIGTLYPGLRPLAFRVLQDVKTFSGRVMNVASAIRSFDKQLEIYSQGRKLVGDKWIIEDERLIVSNSRPGLSWHCYGLAFDCSWAGAEPYLKNETKARREELWKIYCSAVRANGLRSGESIRLVNGVFDIPHAEQTYGLAIDQAMELYAHNGLAAVWAYVDKIRGVPMGQDWERSGLPNG